MGLEAVRERDLNRYFQPYKASQSLNEQAPTASPSATESPSWSLTWDGYTPQFSSDRALTAFAQLATLRLNVRRAMISLVDSKHQYVLTEATRTLSLRRNTIDKEDDRIWLGKSVLNRCDAMCENVFDCTYTVADELGQIYTGDGLVVEDLLKEDKFKDRPFVVGEPHIRFYAGVPIRSRNGHIIGSYACSDNKPRPGGLTIQEFRFMQDMAETVMDHLEMIRDREDRRKGERMVRGLSEFIEGSCVDARVAASSEVKKSQIQSIPNPAATVLERQTENVRGMEADDLANTVQRLTDEPVSRLSGPKATTRVVHPPQTNPTCIFYRAADLIRKSTFADGVVFFHTSGPTIRTRVPESYSSDETSMDDSQSQTSGNENIPPLSSNRVQALKSPKFTTQKAKKAKARESNDVKFSDVLGLSISEGASGQDSLSLKDFQLPERSLERYIKKFPYGKFFSFTDTGSGVSSDDKSESEPNEEPGRLTNDNKTHVAIYSKHAAPKSRKPSFIPTELLKILPGVRTLIFLPLWDSAAERWIAGGFIWTTQASTLLSPHNEMPFLKAFGNSITSEYARMHALISDRAKSDFISSISHETRSPLHGVLGSVEFLTETELTLHQKGLVSSIETCAKTLLETLEHILDYAKINKLYNRDKNPRRLENRLKKREHESSVMGPTAEVDLNQLLEEVAESVCIGHAFRQTHVGSMFTPETHKVSADCNLRHVAVSLEISPRVKYMVRTQPGAIRRIIMNLCGNSIKYTPNGHVALYMRGQESATDPSKIDVVLTFADTGKGMSLEYQRTRLFSPFSQEDPFADGTGLGLSIVRQIVDSLGGHIEIKSTKNVGTTVKVYLGLPIAEGQRLDHMADVYALTKGKRIGLVHANATIDASLQPCKIAFETHSREWFGIDLVMPDEDFSHFKADALICHESSPPLENIAVGTPIIVVCKNQSNQVALRNSIYKQFPECAQSIIYTVAQPMGPRKLAGVFRTMFSQEKPSRPRPDKMYSFDPVHARMEQLDELPRKLEAPNERPGPTPLSHHDRHASSSEDVATVKHELPARAITDPPLPKAAASARRPIPIQLKSGLQYETPPVSHHVLLVDDNAINLQLLTMFMKKIALPHSSARDGLEAFEKYKSCAKGAEPTSNSPAFTYVLMDISMPVMDGLQSTRCIREFERDMGVKKAIIVALTGLASADAQQDALDAGVDFYLPKPVKFADLKRLMEM